MSRRDRLGIANGGIESVRSVDWRRRIPTQFVVPVGPLGALRAADDVAGGVSLGNTDAVPMSLADVGV